MQGVELKLADQPINENLTLGGIVESGIVSASVVLPAPEAPTSAVICPHLMVSEMLCNTSSLGL